tara:strand:- start:208 stop:495 length:288 start_codon:yes stop_codon:yes gene_type:complete
MQEVHKPNGDESGPNYILDLDGPDGNVYYLWGLLDKFVDEDAVEESKNNPPYEGYEGVLDYCLYHLTGCPAGIEFRMYGHDIQQVSDYRYALEMQ